jgi:hypothetical protein
LLWPQDPMPTISPPHDAHENKIIEERKSRGGATTPRRDRSCA